jgi:hypothetical protein
MNTCRIRRDRLGRWRVIVAAPRQGFEEAKASAQQKIAEVSPTKRQSDHKTAELFNTNRTYVNPPASSPRLHDDINRRNSSGQIRFRPLMGATRYGSNDAASHFRTVLRLYPVSRAASATLIVFMSGSLTSSSPAVLPIGDPVQT